MSAPGYKRIEAGGNTLPRENIPSKPGMGSIQEPPPVYTGNAAVVTLPSSKGTGGSVAEPPKDYLVFSVLTILCCFMPLGVIALFKSMEVRSAIQRGDQATALEASKAARKFNKWSLILGIIIFVVVFVATLAIQLAWIIPVVLRHKNGHGKDYDGYHGFRYEDHDENGHDID